MRLFSLFLSSALERKISVRASRDELVQKGILLPVIRSTSFPENGEWCVFTFRIILPITICSVFLGVSYILLFYKLNHGQSAFQYNYFANISRQFTFYVRKFTFRGSITVVFLDRYGISRRKICTRARQIFPSSFTRCASKMMSIPSRQTAQETRKNIRASTTCRRLYNCVAVVTVADANSISAIATSAIGCTLLPINWTKSNYELVTSTVYRYKPYPWALLPRLLFLQGSINKIIR